MNTLVTKLTTTASLAITLGLASASGLTVTFNGASDTFTSQFTLTTTPTWGSGFGILDGAGGSVGGGLRTFSNAVTVLNAGLSTTAKDTFSISTLVKGDWVNIGNGSGALHLGFATASTAGPSYTGANVAGTDSFGLRLEGTTTAGAPIWRTRLNGASASFTPTSGSNAVTGLLSTNWYLVSASFTESATANNWIFSSSITDYGTAGTTAGTVVSSVAGTFIQAATYSASNLFGAVNFRSGGTNATFIDNFSTTSSLTAIPEPSTYAVLAGLGAIGLTVLHRRRHAS